MARVSFPIDLTVLARFFQEAGAVLYAVGGQVRNPLLDYPVQDRDICSSLTPTQVMALCDAHEIQYVPQGVAFGTVRILWGSEGGYEHTTFRRDVYAPGGAHKPRAVEFGTSVAQDAFRRDFTVNALYASVRTGEVQDPTSRGLDDLSHGIICATTPDPDEIMKDDALRVLRMVRFACELGFTIDKSTFASAKKYAKGLQAISAERIRDELSKILLSDVRYGAIAADQGARPGEDSAVFRGLVLLDRLGALDVILPTLTAGRFQVQKLKYHAYTVLYHNLHTAACMDVSGLDEETALSCRLAALLHDIGKPEAKRRNALADASAPLPDYAAGAQAEGALAAQPSTNARKGHMYGHDEIGAGMARDILTRLHYPAAVIDESCALIKHHMYDLTGLAKESTLRERFAEWGYAHSLRVSTLREADVYGSGRTPRTEPVQTAARFKRILADMQREGAPFSESDLQCTGADIMTWLSLPPSPRVGEVKHALLLHCARKPADNTKEKLMHICRDMERGGDASMDVKK